MSVNSYLSNLGSALVLSLSEKASIKKSIDTIKTRLEQYFGEDVIEKKVFGSYSRNTILPRKADENSDVDIMVVFHNPYGYKPQSFLNRIKNFAEYYYSKSEIYQSRPTIVLELNHIKFEITPAYYSYGMYLIPKSASDWMFTNPDSFSDQLSECNSNNNYRIKPIIRILKHWNIQKNDRDMASYELEEKIAKDMKYAYRTCSSYTDYVKESLETIKWLTDYREVNKAIECINDALQLEADGYPYSALSKIKEQFPEV